MSTLATNAITDASGGNTTTINGFTPTVSNMAGRNRIINGDMRIDQRNAGAAQNNISDFTYTVDRWLYQGASSKFNFQQNAGAVTPPLGFTNYLGATVASAVTPAAGDYFRIQQRIEGFNVADIGWGTAGAQTITVSFWVRSSLTGTFGGSLMNSAGNRSYPFPFTISAANTWEQKTITIPGDVTGTWLTDSGIGVVLSFSLGSGSSFTATANTWGATSAHAPTGSQYVASTSGATFYITGVQLEEGSVATPFEHRQYGQELALCQRYCQVLSYVNGDRDIATGVIYSSTAGTAVRSFPTVMRAAPTLTASGLSDIRTYQAGNNFVPTAIALDRSAPTTVTLFTTISGATQGHGSWIRLNGSSAKLELSAEL